MAKSQRIERRRPKQGPIIYDERTPRTPEVPQAQINAATANAPVRTINFVEVGNMVGRQLQLILQRLNETHDTAKGGIHYFLPIRHGKIGSDIVFETEWLDVVNKTCEIRDGKIVLKGEAKEVVVVRQKI
jgi:hypothetical protein